MTKPQTCDRCAERTALYRAMDGRRLLCRPCAAEDATSAASSPKVAPDA